MVRRLSRLGPPSTGRLPSAREGGARHVEQLRLGSCGARREGRAQASGPVALLRPPQPPPQVTHQRHRPRRTRTHHAPPQTLPRPVSTRSQMRVARERMRVARERMRVARERAGGGGPGEAGGIRAHPPAHLGLGLKPAEPRDHGQTGPGSGSAVGPNKATRFDSCLRAGWSRLPEQARFDSCLSRPAARRRLLLGCRCSEATGTAA
jgi:hypothetical protein